LNQAKTKYTKNMPIWIKNNQTKQNENVRQQNWKPNQTITLKIQNQLPLCWTLKAKSH